MRIIAVEVAMAPTPALAAAEFITLRSVESGHAASEPAVRTQVAFIRSLLDEVRRRQSSDAAVAPLLAQIEDEVERLFRLLDEKDSGAPPSSRARPRA
jgi:hypothetical protein